MSKTWSELQALKEKQHLLSAAQVAISQFIEDINNPECCEDLVRLVADLEAWHEELQQEFKRG